MGEAPAGLEPGCTCRAHLTSTASFTQISRVSNRSSKMLGRTSIGVFCTIVSASACDFTVTENLTLFDAQDHLRGFLRAHNSRAQSYTVCLPPGRYDLSKAPLSFSAPDSAPAEGRVYWRATGPRGSAVVSGGVQVMDWAVPPQSGVGVYVARVPVAFSPGAVMRQLWVAGTRANRTVTDTASSLGTATPWESADKAHAGFIVSRIPPAWRVNK